MAKATAVTVRLPVELKRQLALRAKKQHRSLSAQMIRDLEQALATEPQQAGPGVILGRYEGRRVPTDAEIDEVRRRLWARLEPRRSRG